MPPPLVARRAMKTKIAMISSVGPNERSSVRSVFRFSSSGFAFSTTFFSVSSADRSSVFANVGITVSNRSNVFGFWPAFDFGSGTGFLKSPWTVSRASRDLATLPPCTWFTNSV